MKEENIVAENRQKNLREGLTKFTQISAALIRKKIKIIDLIIVVLIVASIAIGYTGNNYFTGMNYTCFDKKSKEELEKYFTESVIINSNFYDCENQCYRKGYTSDSEIDYFKGSSMPTEYPYYGIKCIKDCDLNRITKNEYTSDSTVTTLRWINVAIVICIALFLVYKYALRVVVMKSLNQACDEDSIFTTGLWKHLLIEIIILGIFSPPGYDKLLRGKVLNGSYIYSLDSILLLVYLIKLYYFFRVYWNFSLWTSETVLQIGLKHKLPISTGFILKAQFKYTPYITMIILLVLSVVLFGFLLRIFEYGYAADEGFVYIGKAIENPNFKDYTDTFWVIIITMMTIGYGDIFPSTHLGRIVAFLAALVGMILVSLLIVSMSNFVTFSPEEKKAHYAIKKNEAIESRDKFSAELISNIMKLAFMKKKKCKMNLYFKQLSTVKEAAMNFEKFKIIEKSQVVPLDELLSQVERKAKKDSEVFFHYTTEVKDIIELTELINEEEKEIFENLKAVKELQDEFGDLLVKKNNSDFDLKSLHLKTGENVDSYNLNVEEDEEDELIEFESQD